MFNKKNSVEKNPYSGRTGLIYARVSSKRQEAEGTGLKSQEERCMSLLKSISVPHERTFSETYSGGGDFMSRPKMREMLAYIDKHPHKKFLVVFDDLKRFARDTTFHIKLRSAFKMRDVTLKCLNYNFDESPEGEFVETIFAAQGQLERQQNQRQVVQKMKARLEAGYWPFHTKRGYSYTKSPLHGKILEPNAESTLIAEAINGFLNRTLTRKIDVCRFLVERGFWKELCAKNQIYRLSIILSDPFYAGYIEYPEWEVTRRVGHPLDSG
jgi:DNA invertase Pin-like site-specific DNA recombinase